MGKKQVAKTKRKAVSSATSSASALVTLAVLSQWLNLGQRRVQQLADEGIVVREDRGRYNLQASVSGYLTWLQQRAAPPDSSGIADGAIEQARLRRTVAQADLLEMKTAEARGETVLVSVMAREWGDILRMVRSGVLAIPTRMGAKLPHLTAHDLDELDKELRRVLTDLGNDTAPDASPIGSAEKPDPAAAPGVEYVD